MRSPATGSQIEKLPEILQKWNKEENARFKLTKISVKEARESMVSAGKTIQGDLELVDVAGEVGIKVSRGFDYVRTSPFVRLKEEKENIIIFETEGGVYQLEKVSSPTPHQ